MLVWKIPREAPRHVSFRQHCSHSAQAWICESRAERSATSARQAYCRRSRRWLEFSMSQNLTAKSHDQTSKWPEYHIRIRLGIRSLCFDLHKRDWILRPDQIHELGIHLTIKVKRWNFLSLLKFKETPFWFYFLFQLMIQRIPFKQHNTKNYLSRYRGQMPDIICAVHIPPVYIPTDACLKNTTWSASARLFPAIL